MGVTEVLPGISGGTIALLVGIYDRMVAALAELAIFAKNLVTRQWSNLKQVIDPLKTMVPLIAGMLVGAVIATYTITHLIKEHPLVVWSFIFGIVVGAVYFTWRSSTAKQLMWFFIPSLLVSLGIGLIPAHETTATYPLIYVGATLAFGAWILPGISGSFVLLILGVWSTMMQAIVSFEALKLLTFGAGIATGWLIFSNPVKIFLGRYRTALMATFSGLLAGSLRVLWPWQSEAGVPIPPHQYDGGPQWFMAVSLMILGLVLVVVITHVYTKDNH